MNPNYQKKLDQRLANSKLNNMYNNKVSYDKDSKIQQECTFQPQISQKSKTLLSQRQIYYFDHNQIPKNSERRKRSNELDLKFIHNFMESYSFQPQISQRSREINRKNQKENEQQVHERLNYIKEDPALKNGMDEFDVPQELDELTFKPQISRYNFSKPRNTDMNRPKSSIQHLDNNKEKSKKCFIMNDIQINAFKKELQSVFNKITTNPYVYIYQFQEILIKMHFMKENQNYQQDQLFYQAWNFVSNENFQTVKYNDLFVFLCAIMNSNMSDKVDSQIFLSDPQVRDIHNIFFDLYCYRYQRKQIHEESDQFTFRPQLSQKTKELAEKKQEKIKGEIKQLQLQLYDEKEIYEVDHPTILEYQALKTQNSIEIEQKKKQEQQLPKKKPRINLSDMNLKTFQLHLPKQHQEPKTKDQQDFEKEIVEYTFVPSMEKPKYKHEQINASQEKEIDRLQMARYQREVIYSIIFLSVQVQRIMKEKGCTFNEKKEKEIIQKLINENEKKTRKHPLLVVDVNLGNDQMSQVEIYDQQSIPQIAQDFGRKHYLSQELVFRLEHLLKLQYDNL